MSAPIKVLIVDDREVVRLTLKSVLLGFDCDFWEAPDGATALKLISAIEFDVVFLDLMLPDLSGIEVLSEARRLGATLGSPIILTGLPDPGTQAQARELGALYLKKPLEYEEIRRVFAQVTAALPQSYSSAAVPEVAQPEDGIPPLATAGSQEGPPRLLVLDNNNSWLDTMETMLGKEFSLAQTTDDEEACQWVENEPFALVIIDMKLADGKSGLDVLSRMRKTRPYLRAIILTGYPDYDSARVSGERGADAYVRKRKWRTLLETVRKLLNEKRPPRIFLCYDRRDKTKVLRLYKKLTDLGFHPWMDIEGIKAGRQWELEIRRAIDQSDYFIFCASRHSLSKEGFIREEIEQALERQVHMPEESIFFVTARLEELELQESISKLQSADLFRRGGFTRLLRAFSRNSKTDE